MHDLDLGLDLGLDLSLALPRCIEWIKVKCKYVNGKPIRETIFDGNYSNI